MIWHVQTRSKYRAVRTKVGNIEFASKREANRYVQLRLLEKGGQISNLELQVPLQFPSEDDEIFRWVADFVYWEGTHKIWEDCKGFRTPVYKLKKRIIEHHYGITIRET